MHAALGRTFASLVVDARVAVNFSLRLAKEPDSFHIMSWGNCPVLRTLDIERLIVGLLRFVGNHGESPEGTFRTTLAAAVRDGQAILVGRDIRERLVKDERALRRQGFSVQESPWADIDLRTGELVVSDPNLIVDADGLEELRAMSAPARRHEGAVRQGRYPVAGVIVSGDISGSILSRAEAAYEIARASATPISDRQAADMLATLGGFAERVQIITADTSKEAREQILQWGLAADKIPLSAIVNGYDDRTNVRP